ncbi:hypothetical protein KSP40_PGU016283 [Platanthera guangdongensis]|uniref:Cyanobacterial aminoacyl-tRNA synthetase CAAD domain-containing protein n=1 Tax=Platanthera guangdongensis TaxID=2320717 RepID=A0ABR2LMS9_9ASPA
MTLATAAATRALPFSRIVAGGRLPPLLHDSSPVRHSQGSRSFKFLFYCHKAAPNVVAMATGETPAEVATQLPEFGTTLQEAWEKLDDKYAVASLAIVSLIALYGSVGLISAIDRLPVVPGLFELVGIGYTGWFVYSNLVFKPDREALVAKLKDIYSDVLGSSS